MNVSLKKTFIAAGALTAASTAAVFAAPGRDGGAVGCCSHSRSEAVAATRAADYLVTVGKRAVWASSLRRPAGSENAARSCCAGTGACCAPGAACCDAAR